MSEPASVEAEISTEIDPSTLSPAEAVAHNATTGNPTNQADIMSAWKKTIQEVGELDPEQDPAKVATDEDEPEAEAKPAKPAKATKAAKAEEEAEPEAEADSDEEAKPAKLTQADNRALTQARIALNQRFQRREAAQMQRFQEREQQLQRMQQEHSATFQPLIDAARAIEAGDFDGFAKGIGGYLKDPALADWNKLNEVGLQAVQSPVYKRMRQLERQQAEALEQQRKQQEQQAQLQAQHAQAAQIQAWKDDLKDSCVAHEDPAIASLIESRPQLVDAIFNIQQAHYHQTGGDVLEPADAVAQLLTNVRNDFKFWSEYFESHSESPLLSGIQAASPKPAKTAVRGATLERQTAKKTSGPKQPATRDAAPAPAVRKSPPKSISQAQTSGASQIALKSDKEIKAHFERLIQQEWQQS